MVIFGNQSVELVHFRHFWHFTFLALGHTWLFGHWQILKRSLLFASSHRLHSLFLCAKILLKTPILIIRWFIFRDLLKIARFIILGVKAHIKLTFSLHFILRGFSTTFEKMGSWPSVIIVINGKPAKIFRFLPRFDLVS